jgi:trimeric autotransporter adhesin
MKPRLYALILFFFALHNKTAVYGQIITTVAGNGSYSFAGDGGPATNAQCGYAVGVAIDAVGNLYLSEQGPSIIRKVNSFGIIHTIAGDTSFYTGMGYSGDNGPATAAKLNGPQCIVIDNGGSLFFNDNSNGRIRRIDPSGIITTVAGNGTVGYSGDGGPATVAGFYGAYGIAVDRSGNLFIADQLSNRVRVVNSSGIISTFAGTGISGSAGDGGPAIAAQLCSPASIAIDAHGNVFIGDVGCGRIRKVSPSGIITTVAGSGISGFSGDGGAATLAKLNNPHDICVDTFGNLYISDVANHRVRKVDPSGTISTFAGIGVLGSSGDGGPATAAQINGPFQLTTDKYGNVYLVDGDNRIRKVTVNNVGTPNLSPTDEVLRVYPNPNNGHFYVIIPDIVSETDLNISVTNIIGQKVHSDVVSVQKNKWEIKIQLNNSLPNGLYFLWVNRGVHGICQKFVIQR